jgi:Flp pilus assembly protein TadG
MEQPKKQIWRKFRKRFSRGSVVVEAVIILPFLIWMVFCVIQYGIVLNTATTLTDIDRDAARYAAENASGSTTINLAGNSASVQAYVKLLCTNTKGAFGQTVDYNDLCDASGNTGAGPYVGTMSNSGAFTAQNSSYRWTYGDNIAVTIYYPLSKKVFAGSLVPGMSNFTSKPYRKTTAMIVEVPAAS